MDRIERASVAVMLASASMMQISPTIAALLSTVAGAALAIVLIIKGA